MSKPIDPFQAGWEAHERLVDHEWGPCPANSWVVAKGEWERSCEQGHWDCDEHPGATKPPQCFMCHRVMKAGVCTTKGCHMEGHERSAHRPEEE